MMDVVLYLAILVLFASWMAIHTVLSWSIAQQKIWRGLLAFVFFPLAPLWGQRFGRLATAWVIVFVAYGMALIAGLL